MTTAHRTTDDPHGAVARRRAQVFRALREAVLVTDVDGTVVDCNPAAEDMYGAAACELIGRTGFVHDAQDRAALERGEQQLTEQPFGRPDGSTGIESTTVVGLFDDDGGLSGTARISRDVTQDRRVALELTAAEERWRMTLDGAPSGIALVALDGRFVRCNQALCEMVDYPEADLLALTFQDISHPDDLGEDLNQLGRLTRGEIDSYSMSKRYLRRGGTVVWVAMSVALVKDPHTGEPLHLVAQMRDVTAERAASDRLQSIIASASDAFVGISSHGHVTEWNTAAEELFGWLRDEALGHPLGDLIVPAEQRVAHRDGLRRLAEGGDSTMLDRPVELVGRHRDGQRLPIELTIWRPGSSGEFYAFARDIGDRVRAEEAAREAAERQAAIVAAQLAISAVELSPRKVMQEICTYAQQLTGADGAVIALVEGSELVYQAATGSDAANVGMRFVAEGTLSGLAIAHERALICDDTEVDPRVDAEECRRASARSMVAAPLRRRGEVVGALKVVAADAVHFDGDDLATLELLAAPFGAALSNAWRLEATSEQALTDHLTSLANRELAVRELDRALDRQATRGGFTAVLFCDLDGFKKVNDTFGHAAGDQMLTEVAGRLRAAVRSTDTPARFGGDEFLIVCDGLKRPEHVEVLARRLIASIPGSYPLAAGEATIGMSVGVAVADTCVPAADLLREADEAMYEVKNGGGNHYLVRHLGAGG